MKPTALLLLLAAALALAGPAHAARLLAQARPELLPAAGNATEPSGAGLVLGNVGVQQHACGGGGTATRLVGLKVAS